MPFEKGDKRINRKGRPPGESDNVKKTRELIGLIVNENLPLIRRDLKKMGSKQRALVIERLLRFYLPTLRSEDVKIDFEQLDDEAIDIIVERIIGGKYDG